MAWREMLNTPLACMLWLTFIFGATSGLMAIGQWKRMMRVAMMIMFLMQGIAC